MDKVIVMYSYNKGAFRVYVDAKDDSRHVTAESVLSFAHARELALGLFKTLPKDEEIEI